MRDYFSDMITARLQDRHPILMKRRARYDPAAVRNKLRAGARFDDHKMVPYVVFPLDLRWLYYETEHKFLNEARADLYKNLQNNEFFVTVPEPRQESETKPVLLTTAFDLHLHNRGSVSFPVETLDVEMPGPLLAAHNLKPQRKSNLAPKVWEYLKLAFNLKGDLWGKDARHLARRVVRVSLALCHSPQYQLEHKDSLGQDWAHLPIPKRRGLFDELADTGEDLAILLNPAKSPLKVLRAILGSDLEHLGILSTIGGGNVSRKDLTIKYAFLGAAQGGWRGRAPAAGEPMHDEWSSTTGDLYINDTVYFRHVPEPVWRYELGGYPVIKKWLAYRDGGRRANVALSVQEVTHLRSMVQRLSAVLLLRKSLDCLYERACQDCFIAEDFGL
jgi:hypothetical protein